MKYKNVFVFMVFFRTLRCAQKHVNYNTKQHFDEWRSKFYSLQRATKTLKKQSNIHFLGAETPPNRSSESCETLANGNKILAISTLLGICGGAIHLQSGALSHYIGNECQLHRIFLISNIFLLQLVLDPF